MKKKNYLDCMTTEDKIVHALIAAWCAGNDIYDQYIKECISTYGITITSKALTTFNTEYQSLKNKLI